MIISLTKQLASPVIQPYGTDTPETSSHTGRPNILHVVNCTAVAVYGTENSPSQISTSDATESKSRYTGDIVIGCKCNVEIRSNPEKIEHENISNHAFHCDPIFFLAQRMRSKFLSNRNGGECSCSR
jgi:hypothetical protein